MAREEKVKALRLMQIDEMIRDGNYPNAGDIGKKFSISRSTVMRDLDFLRDRYHAPIEYDKDHNGFHYTDKSFFVKSVMLTEGELFSVSAILPLLEQYKNTPLESSFRNIFEKLSAMLPNQVSVDTSLLKRDFTYVGEPAPVIDAEIFNRIFEAVKNHRTVTFQYRSISRSEYKDHTFNPYQVICRNGDWYVIGFCHNHYSVRTYSLARMKNLEATNASFELPEDFDMKNYRDLTFGVFTSKESPVKIHLHFNQALCNYVLERKWHETQEIEQNEDGSVELKFMSNQLEEICRLVMRFGSAVKVIEPENLVEMVKNEAQKISDLYRG